MVALGSNTSAGDESQDGRRLEILIVDDEPDGVALLERTFHGHTVVGVESSAEALRHLEQGRFDLVVSDFRMPGMSGTELLERCKQLQPEARRVLVTAYEDLPEVIRARSLRVAEKVFSKPIQPRKLRRAVIDFVLLKSSKPALAVGEQSLDEGGASSLLRATVALAVQVEGIVIRPLPPQAAGQIELVAPQGSELERLRENLPRKWGWPCKARGHRGHRSLRKNPAVRLFKGLSREQELYVRPLEGGGFVYLGIFPWRREAKSTLVLGFTPEAPAIEVMTVLGAVHRHAVEIVGEYSVPELAGADADDLPFAYDPSYDWVVTRRYVGPDRRRKPTRFVGRHTFLGRRKRLPELLSNRPGTFVDRLPTWVWALTAMGLLLAVVDTWLTFVHVGSGRFAEFNPLLRWLIALHPVMFWLVKSSLALVAFFVVIRWHLWRPGRWGLVACVAGYLALDLYWMYLLGR